MSYSPYVCMALLVVTTVLLSVVLVYVVKIYKRQGQDQIEAIDPMLAKILKLLDEKKKGGYTPPAPSGGTAEKPQKPVDIERGSDRWRCLENEEGTQISKMSADGQVLKTFQVDLWPVEDVLWALCQL